MIEVVQGSGPIVLGLPHTGIDIPKDIWDKLNNCGQNRADTDWHVHHLYNGLIDDVTTVRTPIHRYVIDVNRAPDGQSLYPGQNTTGLCPVTDFDGTSIYREGCQPDAAEIARRAALYHVPYHAALSCELARVKALHGVAILYDCHSIRSVIPYLFEEILPDFNIGTNLSTTCDACIETCVTDICAAARGYTSVLNGRFKGGWTTRNYGRPENGIHAIQMELAQSTYMSERPPWTYDATKAEALRPILKRLFNGLKHHVHAGDLA
jgi:N-formylglutamate deformylase